MLSRTARVSVGVIGALGMAVFLPSPGVAQSLDGDAIEISLLTFGPGELAWERFGHNGIRVRDRARGIDVMYDYGRFAFEEGFIPRFIRGHMEYWMEASDTEFVIDRYRAVGRSIWEQRLRLTPDQRADVAAFLAWNDRDDNRFYRYDYYFDNCSTRLRDVLDRAIGGEIRVQTETRMTDATFRSHTQRLTTNSVLLYTGLLAGLGQPVDRPISAWEEMFLPLKLRDHLDSVTVTGPGGGRVPLVVETRTIFESDRYTVDSAPPAWGWRYLLVGLAGTVVIAAAGLLKRLNRFRWVFTVVGTGWMAVVGVGGVILAGLWLATDHSTSYRNENLFLFSPLAFPLAALLPLALHGVRWAANPARWLVMFVMGSAVIGAAVQGLPWFNQVNGQLVALLVLPTIAVGGIALRGIAVAPGRTSAGRESQSEAGSSTA